jgi:hypothetical protein
MTRKALKIEGVALQRAASMAAGAGGALQAPLQLAIALGNLDDKALHVWSSWRAYEYDAATHVLTVYLTEHTPPVPQGIKLISNHPRTPGQVQVAAKGKVTLKVDIPATIRRRTPSPGLGMTFVEEAIDPVDQVTFHIQYAYEPIVIGANDTPEQHRAHMRERGDVVQATITPTGQKE